MHQQVLARSKCICMPRPAAAGTGRPQVCLQQNSNIVLVCNGQLCLTMLHGILYGLVVLKTAQGGKKCQKIRIIQVSRCCGYVKCLCAHLLHFGQMRSVHAIPSLLPGEVCACNSFAVPDWMCAWKPFISLLSDGVCAIYSLVPDCKCAHFAHTQWGVQAIVSLLPGGVWMCESVTCARLEVWVFPCVGTPVGGLHPHTPV